MKWRREREREEGRVALFRFVSEEVCVRNVDGACVVVVASCRSRLKEDGVSAADVRPSVRPSIHPSVAVPRAVASRRPTANRGGFKGGRERARVDGGGGGAVDVVRTIADDAEKARPLLQLRRRRHLRPRLEIPGRPVVRSFAPLLATRARFSPGRPARRVLQSSARRLTL